MIINYLLPFIYKYKDYRFLLKLRYILLNRINGNFIANKKTTICIEGFPRSANSYFVRLFKFSNPHHNIAHHTHSLANIKYSLNNKIPIVCLIREPADAIASYCIYSKINNINYALKSYIHFYQFIQKNKTNMIIAEFSKVIANSADIIKKIRLVYGNNFSLLDNEVEISGKVKDDIDNKYSKDELRKYQNTRKPLPNNKRNKEKESLMILIRKDKLYQNSLNIFNDLNS
tara:strand:- start:333 stop:1022 length:690 start_codon:yes stop_codon:yes gene_type:complete